MKKQFLTLAASVSIAVGGFGSSAMAGGGIELPQQRWSFEGAFGTYDKASMQRGYKVYRNVCAACHGMKRVAYRNLVAIGYNEDQIKALASEITVAGELNEEGEPTERSGLPSDYHASPYANEKQAAYVNKKVPPDLSLITKARVGGADYIYALMTGYEDAPSDVEVEQGLHWNEYFSGHKIAMAAPLSDGIVSYEDGMPETIEQYSKDVAHFLNWAAEPEMEARKRMGVKVVVFLLIFAGLMYGLKRRIWAGMK